MSGENGNRDPVTQVEEKINNTPASKEPEVPGVLKDVTNKQPPVNSEKDVPVVTIDESETQTKEAEAEVPWVLEEEALRIFGEEPNGEDPKLVLHSSVAKRWKKYLTDGLTKEVKDSLLKKISACR